MSAPIDPSRMLTGPRLALAGFALALSNFMVVLDTTIANVSVPHIAGSLAITPSQGTWIITSYSVAEAICVPLTGFLTARFGAVRTFVVCLVGFALFSMLCGMSVSLTMLVACRVGQGLCGGPLMPLTQTLLLRIFPKEKHGAAMGLWAMTTVVAPVLGPILGGILSDDWSWHWIFFINLPVAALCATVSYRMLRPVETRLLPSRIDRIGLALMVVWIGALQIMLDLGHDRDWFADSFIVTLAIVAVIGFALFCAWEITERQPAVDLRVFRHAGFSVSVIAMPLAFGSFFITAVIVPQWLQSSLGYTATYAGYTTAFTGVLAVVMAPVVSQLVGKFDPRAIVSFGVLVMAASSLMRAHWTSGADFWTLALPQLLQGVGMPCFFIPITTIGLGAVDPDEVASAAGLMSFLRTMSGAVGTSIATTAWDSESRVARSELAARLHSDNAVHALGDQGFSLGQTRLVVEQLVTKESMALATDHLFLVTSLIFAISAMIIWAVPRPQRIASGPAH